MYSLKSRCTEIRNKEFEDFLTKFTFCSQLWKTSFEKSDLDHYKVTLTCKSRYHFWHLIST